MTNPLAYYRIMNNSNTKKANNLLSYKEFTEHCATYKDLTAFYKKTSDKLFLKLTRTNKDTNKFVFNLYGVLLGYLDSALTNNPKLLPEGKTQDQILNSWRFAVLSSHLNTNLSQKEAEEAINEGWNGVNNNEITLEEDNPMTNNTEIDYNKAFDEIAEQTSKAIEQDKAQPLIDWGTIAPWLNSLPEKQEELFTSGAWCLAKGVVNCIPAKGGVGKSFYAIELAMSLATGTNILKPWTPTRPVGVAYLTAEDPEDKLNERVYWINQAFDELKQNRELLIQNFKAKSLVGTDTRLLKLDSQRNATNTDFYNVLDDSIAALKCSMPDLKVIFFDTLSRFFGLNENDNQSGADFISLLEKLAQKHDITPVVLCHTSKEGAKGDINDISVRGASSIVDNARYCLPMRVMDKDKAKKDYKIENFKDYVEVCPNKNNYTAGESHSQWYKRNEHGVLIATSLVQKINEETEKIVKDLIDQYYTWETEEQFQDVVNNNPLVFSQIKDITHTKNHNDGVKIFIKLLRDNKITLQQFLYAFESLQMQSFGEYSLIEVKNNQNKPTKVIANGKVKNFFENPTYQIKQRITKTR